MRFSLPLLAVSIYLCQIFLILQSRQTETARAERPRITYIKRNNNNDDNRQQPSGWVIGGDSSNLFNIGTNKQLTATPVVDREQVPIGNEQIELIGGPDFEPASCQLAKVVLVLQRPGCQAKAISSYACTGSCPSYVQVSGSNDWKHERSCSCCQQTAIQEDTFVLDCPALTPPYREVKTYAPVNCICRSCSDISREIIKPQELIEALEGQITS